MFKTININLGGRLIPIDEPAYKSLNDYIDWLRRHFGKEPGGDEIVRDMEDRISEIFAGKIKPGHPSISEQDVQDLITVMGSPEQIAEETADDTIQTNDRNGQQEVYDDVAAPPAAPTEKRLCRSGSEKVIGGVCGGLAYYFNIDPAIIRFFTVIFTLFYGTGAIAYIILMVILPVNPNASPTLPKRLYRNTDNKIIGGVCSGLASFRNIDPVIPRLIFALGILGSWWIGRHDFLFGLANYSGMPSIVMIYFILWVSLPKATTITQKLQMEGKPVNVKNVTEAAKVAQTTPEHKHEYSPLKTLAKILGYSAIGVVLLMFISILFAILWGMFRLSRENAAIPIPQILHGYNVNLWLLWTCIILIFLVPVIALIRFALRMSNNKPGSKLLKFVLPSVWGLAVIGLIYYAGNIAANFEKRASFNTYVNIPAPSNDTLTVGFNLPPLPGIDSGTIDESILFWENNHKKMVNGLVDYDFQPSGDSAYHMEIKRSSYGPSKTQASAFANGILYQYVPGPSVLNLPFAFTQDNDPSFHLQQLKITVFIPAGKVFYIDQIIEDHIEIQFGITEGRKTIYRKRNVKKYSDFSPRTYYRMESSGPVALSNHEDNGKKQAETNAGNSDDNNQDNDND